MPFDMNKRKDIVHPPIQAPVHKQSPLLQNRSDKKGGLSGLFRSILPKNIDMGDLLLLVLLFLLYSESGDEEFLIILAIVFLLG